MLFSEAKVTPDLSNQKSKRKWTLEKKRNKREKQKHKKTGPKRIGWVKFDWMFPVASKPSGTKSREETAAHTTLFSFHLYSWYGSEKLCCLQTPSKNEQNQTTKKPKKNMPRTAAVLECRRLRQGCKAPGAAYVPMESPLGETSRSRQ